MILHVYTMTWNEEYMMPYFLRHYEPLADRIFVIDDESTDRTLEIVSASPKVTVLPCPFKGLQELLKARTFSRVYRTYSRGIADWVIVVDCDEFIYHPRLLQILEEQKAAGTQIIRPDKGWIIGSKKTPHTDGQLYDACDLGYPRSGYRKPVIFDPEIDVWFSPGQHYVKSPGAVRVTNTGIHLLHCCYLSREWIIDHLERRWSRMPPHESARMAAGGITLESAKKWGLGAYNYYMKPWKVPCVS